MSDCYLKNNNKEQCSGCGACANICPKNAIQMVEDNEGFKYPTIDKEKCINCGLCERTCPIIKQLPIVKPKSYLYISNDEENLLSSTSGGAFSEIAKIFYEKDRTTIYGCTYEKENQVVHVGVNNISDIDQFKKSKYVQSDLKNTYKEIKSLLDKNEKVLFSGTPCQVSGLKSFLKKEYDNLLCVDIVCHGVPSQKLFDYYICNEERKKGEKLKKFTFREKVENNKKTNSANVKLEFENGDVVTKPSKESTYMKGFSSRLFYRPSCYNCKFASINRMSDITICDLWGITEIDISKYNKGISGIIVNTEKGSLIIDKIEGIKKEISISQVVKTNECYTKPTNYNKNREKFFKNLTKENFDYKSTKYSKKTIIKRINEFIKKRLKISL